MVYPNLHFVIRALIESPHSSAGLDRPLFTHWKWSFCLLAPLNTIISIHKWDIASSCLLLCAYSHCQLFLSHYLNLAHTNSSVCICLSITPTHMPTLSYLPLSCCFCQFRDLKLVFSLAFIICMCMEAVIEGLQKKRLCSDQGPVCNSWHLGPAGREKFLEYMDRHVL